MKEDNSIKEDEITLRNGEVVSGFDEVTKTWYNVRYWSYRKVFITRLGDVIPIDRMHRFSHPNNTPKN